MLQNYLIFIQQHKLEIAPSASGITTFVYDGKTETPAENEITSRLRALLQKLEDGRLAGLKCFSPEPGRLFEQLKACFDLRITAAGGLAASPAGKLLVIFRNGKWDLPKGKMEAGESPAESALREVTEETGLKNPALLHEFARTYHTYAQHGKRIFKETIWFAMRASSTETHPQTEEGITRIEWMDESRLEEALSNTYENIAILLKAFFRNG